jgi:transposase
MDTHNNAPLTPKGREAMVRCVAAGLSKAAAARQFNTTPKTVAKWVERFRAGGVDGLRDRSSRPLSLPSQTAPATCTAVEALRRQRYTGKQIAAEVGVSPATVSRILQRLGLNKLSALEPAEPVRRYEREHPGEIIHIDIKKLGRFEQVGHRITGDRRAKATAAGSAGNICIWRSTTTPAWLTRKSCLTKNATLACAFSSTRCASSGHMALRLSAS